MAYITGGDILGTHYNGFANSINTIWATGSTDQGYGQPNALATVSVGQDVTATQWSALLNRMSSMAAHQGTSIAAVTNPVSGDDITAISTISGNISSLTSNRLNNVANTTDAYNNIVASGSWINFTVQTGSVTFSSANAARYFFNAGGELRISFSRFNGTAHAKNTEWTSLASDCGTLVLGARTFTKIGGIGTVNILNNFGFHDLTTTYNTNFKQFADLSPYTANYINVELRTSLGGSRIDIQTVFVDAAADNSIPASVDVVDGTLTTTITERGPSSANLTDTWGNPTFSGVTNSQT